MENTGTSNANKTNATINVQGNDGDEEIKVANGFTAAADNVTSSPRPVLRSINPVVETNINSDLHSHS